jgi:hypothetical protein
MKKINDVIKKLSPEETQDIIKTLKIKNDDSTSTLLSRLLSYYGLYLNLSNLSADELSVLKTASSDEKGLTFGEIEKILGIPTHRIEEIANNLSKKLLVYVLKNRQLLHNKLDKIYIFPEILELLEYQDNNRILHYLEKLLQGIEEDIGGENDLLQNIKNDKTSLKLINALYEGGGIITFYEALKTISVKSLDKILTKLKNLNIIEIHFDFSFPFTIFILLNERIFLTIKKQRGLQSAEKNYIHNHYNLILNLINTYDTVSSHGLFLTKQKKFRKIDKKRTLDSMNKIHDADGTEIDTEITLQLALNIFFTMKNLTIKHDAVIINLSNIEKDLDNPFKILKKILKNLYSDFNNPLFHSPFSLPSLNSQTEIIFLISKYIRESIASMSLIFVLSTLLKYNMKELKNITQIRKKILSDFYNCIRFLCIAGIIDINNGILELSDIGYEVGSKLFKVKLLQKEPRDLDKNIYINPDFTLIIPQREIPSEALYHILTHTDIIKEDIILHSRINKQSIIRAHKRGMSHDNFLSTLKRYSKNDIPQNLHFLITDWSENIVQIKILNPTILYTNYPSLIDEIAYGDIKHAILERLSENYAIIDRNFLSEIIKMTNKKDAIIRIFEDID